MHWRGFRARGSVHPRGGGELRDIQRHIDSKVGSSPRGRGTRYWQPPRIAPLRFIPAGAGNSGTPHQRQISSTVHPRGGGELGGLQPLDGGQRGSSPRGRGTPSPARNAPRRGRFIPAGAGNSRPGNTSMPHLAVHPRGGGELFWFWCWLAGLCGSSPRGRGTPAQHRQHCPGGRFIPAGAGNSAS